VAALGALALVAAACGKSTTATSSGASGGTSASIQQALGTKIQGGTVTWAEGPNAAPNYIFPIAPVSDFSVPNLSQFQVLMYRPLYWFGNNYTASVNYDYSLAQAPVWSSDHKTVTMTMNPYKWSDGESVTSRGVVFFMNLLDQEKANFGAYAPGYFPDNVASVSAPDPSTVVFHLTAAANPDWFLYNELSQVTPFPLAWDVTSASATPPTTEGRVHLPEQPGHQRLHLRHQPGVGRRRRSLEAERLQQHR
jgi:peptide/nickel transport system substrate-binding protein